MLKQMTDKEIKQLFRERHETEHLGRILVNEYPHMWELYVLHPHQCVNGKGACPFIDAEYDTENLKWAAEGAVGTDVAFALEAYRPNDDESLYRTRLKKYSNEPRHG